MSQSDMISAMRTMMENFSSGIAVLDCTKDDPEYLIVNEACASLLGTDEETLLEEKLSGTAKRIHPDDLERWMRDAKMMISTGRCEGVYRYYNPEKQKYVYVRIDGSFEDGFAYISASAASSQLNESQGNSLMANMENIRGAAAVFRDIGKGYAETAAVSDDFCRMMGCRKEEALELYPTSLDLIAESDRGRLIDFYDGNRLGGSVEEKLVRKDGSGIYVNAEYTAFYHEGQQYIYTLYTDITELVLKEQQYQNFMDADALVIECSKALQKARPLAENLEEVLGRITEYMDALDARIILRGEDGHYRKRFGYRKDRWTGGPLKKEGFTDRDIEPWLEPFSRMECVRIDSPEEIKDTMPEYYAVMVEEEARNILTVPMMQEEKLIGYFGVLNPEYGKLEQSYGTLNSLASFMSSAIINEQNVVSILNSKEQLLRYSGSYYKELGYFRAYRGETLLRARIDLSENKVMELMPSQDVSGMTYDQVLHSFPSFVRDETGVPIVELLDRITLLDAFEGSEKEFSFVYRMPGATVRWVKCDVRLYQSPDSGNVEMFFYTVDDTGAELQKRLAERVSEEMYEMTAVINPENSTIWFFRRNEEMDYDLALERDIEQHIPDEDADFDRAESSLERIQSELEKNGSFTRTVKYRPDEEGKVSWKFCQYVWLDDEKKLILLTVTDVTRQYEEEEKRNAEQARLEKIHNAFVEGLNRVHDAELMIDLEEDSFYMYQISRSFRMEKSGTFDQIYSRFVGSFPEGSEERELFSSVLTRESMQKLLSDGSLYETNYRRILNDGTVKWFTFYMAAVMQEEGKPVRYVMIATTDITDAVEKQEALQGQIESDTAILQQSSLDAYDFIAVIDVNEETITLRGGSWFNVNVPTPEEMRVLPYNSLLGYIGRNYSVTDEEGKAFYQKFAVENIIEGLKTSREVFFPFDFLDAEEKNRVKYKQFRFSWLDEAHTKILATRSDVTTAMEKEKENNLRMKDALQAAEAANAAKSEFLSRMSHDIRTPMNAIIGFSTLLLQNTEDPEKVRDQSKKILSSSNHLLGLINDVLDMSKIETGRFQMNVHEFSLSETISVIDGIMRPQMESRNQTFDLYVSNVRHDTFVGDPQRIQQVLINILSNATKYTQSGGSISMRVKSLPETSGKFETVSFEVADNGRGMSEEFLQEIFEPFSREQLESQENAQGTGLGMAITKNLVNMMGGTVTVDSKLGEGSAFTVVIPLHLSDRETDYAFWQNHSLTHMMVVDDEEEVCQNVVDTMEGTGVRMEYELSGEKAVARLNEAASEKDDFDIVLLDWKMPGMDGVETARRIRKTLSRDVLIIVLTAYDYSYIEDEAREAGVDGFMPKPFFMQSLERALLESGRLDQEEKQNALAEEVSSDEEIDLSGMRVLAAEDNALNAEILVEILKMDNVHVTVAENGKRALECFKEADPGAYDLILMDIQMPVMDGYEAAASIRKLQEDVSLSLEKREEAGTIPIVAMTANAFSDDVQSALHAGMNAHIAKPLDVGILRRTMAAVKKNKGEKA